MLFTYPGPTHTREILITTSGSHIHRLHAHRYTAVLGHQLLPILPLLLLCPRPPSPVTRWIP